MTTEQLVPLKDLDGFTWNDNGQAVLTGRALELYWQLEQMFLSWAANYSAQQWKMPTFISARHLAKLDYFHSFPQLITMPVTLDSAEENVAAFAGRTPIDEHGELHLTKLSAIKDVLTPATCYHFYVGHQGQRLDSPRYLTACANCFRRESEYLPLQRQWSFNMREIVCIGNADEVKSFLASWKTALEQFFIDAQMDVKFANATDPFFKPSRNPKYLMQKLDPVKEEMIFRNHLAIGSINFHRSYFGEAFSITRADEEASSGCVAFGMERWLFALVATFGTGEIKLPELRLKR
ncbi:MAG TPA: aminoacyl--tRNA ligase-related protein [Planktothrix sp.]|jgi:seryl-tRNA synthetase